MEALRAALGAGAGGGGPAGLTRGAVALLDALEDAGLGPPDVLVGGVGGVGTNLLAGFLRDRGGFTVSLGSDADGLKHAPWPPAFADARHAPRAFVQLLGDPLTVVGSHYRRGHAETQAVKTAGSASAAARLAPDLAAYVDAGEDVFGLEANVGAWLDARVPYDVLFVKYDALWAPGVVEAVVTFVAGKCGRACSAADARALAAEFPARKERATQVPDDLRSRCEIYRALERRLDALPPCFVLPAGS